MQRKVLAAAAALGLATVLSFQNTARAALIVSDDFNAPIPSGGSTGFALNSGVNTGINPPTSTRLTGSVAADLRWIRTAITTAKPESDFSLPGDTKLGIINGANSGRVSLSNGTAAFNFATALGIASATPGNPVVYDLAISMDNNTTGTQRMSFGWATVETDATAWDFGVQLYKAANGSTVETVGVRIDTLSSGLATDTNAPASPVTNAANSEVPFLIRVTDAGAETTTFNSRVQVSVNGGASWIYDTATDASLTNGFRFDGAGRFLSLDIAGNHTATTLYDDLSINTVPEPATMGLAAVAGLVMLRRRRV